MWYIITVFAIAYIVIFAVGWFKGGEIVVSRLNGAMLGIVYNETYMDEDLEGVTLHSVQICTFLLSTQIMWTSYDEEEE